MCMAKCLAALRRRCTRGPQRSSRYDDAGHPQSRTHSPHGEAHGGHEARLGGHRLVRRCEGRPRSDASTASGCRSGPSTIPRPGAKVPGRHKGHVQLDCGISTGPRRAAARSLSLRTQAKCQQQPRGAARCWHQITTVSPRSLRCIPSQVCLNF